MRVVLSLTLLFCLSFGAENALAESAIAESYYVLTDKGYELVSNTADVQVNTTQQYYDLDNQYVPAGNYSADAGAQQRAADSYSSNNVVQPQQPYDPNQYYTGGVDTQYLDNDSQYYDNHYYDY